VVARPAGPGRRFAAAFRATPTDFTPYFADFAPQEIAVHINVAPSDTGEIRAVGEHTRFLGIQDTPFRPRRTPGSGKTDIPRTAFAFVGRTGELPILVYAPYVGLHRAPEDAASLIADLTPAEVVPAAEVPSLLARIVAALRRIGG
jgi:hypothetical protein